MNPLFPYYPNVKSGLYSLIQVDPYTGKPMSNPTLAPAPVRANRPLRLATPISGNNGIVTSSANTLYIKNVSTTSVTQFSFNDEKKLIAPLIRSVVSTTELPI